MSWAKKVLEKSFGEIRDPRHDVPASIWMTPPAADREMIRISFVRALMRSLTPCSDAHAREVKVIQSYTTHSLPGGYPTGPPASEGQGATH